MIFYILTLAYLVKFISTLNTEMEDDIPDVEFFWRIHGPLFSILIVNVGAIIIDFI